MSGLQCGSVCGYRILHTYAVSTVRVPGCASIRRRFRIPHTKNSASAYTAYRPLVCMRIPHTSEVKYPKSIQVSMRLPGVAKAQETRAKTYRASAERKAELIAAAARADICDMEEQLAVSAIQLAAALKEKADLIKQAKMDGMAMRAAD